MTSDSIRYLFITVSSLGLILAIYAAVRMIYLERKERKRIDQIDIDKIDFSTMLAQMEQDARSEDKTSGKNSVRTSHD